MAHNVIAEAKRCLNCKKPLCRTGCPISTPIPDFIQTFLKGDIDEAGRMLFDNNPLSAVCSIVCNHGNQCQGHCIRGLKGEPVEVSTIENFISERYLDSLELTREKANGIKVILASVLPATWFSWNQSIKDAPQRVAALNKLIKQYAADNKIPYVDYYSAMVAGPDGTMNPAYSGDGVHPNTEGYKVMESVVKPVIDKTLKKK